MPVRSHELVRFGAVLAAIVAFKLWLAAWFPVTGDEAYFIVWGVRPDWGYYDHPPMVGWLLAAMTRLSLAPWAVRLPVVLLPTVISIGIYLSLRRRAADAAFYAAIAFALLPLNVWNVFITTDTPLIFFAFVSGLAWWRARERASTAWYIAAGVLLGLAFLSKYFSVLLAIVYIVDTALAPRGARPWRGLLVTLASVVPFGLVNLAWNYEHCWANLMFNVYNRNEEAGFSLGSAALFLVIALYTLSPVALVQLARARPSLARLPVGARFFVLAVAVPFALFAVLSFVRPVGLHWVLSFVPFFFIAAGLVLRPAQLRASALYLGVFSLIHVAGIAAASALPLETWKRMHVYDGVVFHFRIQDVVAAMKKYEPEFVLAADGYSPAVTASYYADEYVFVFGTGSSHARHDDLLTDFRALDGRNILVFRKNAPAEGEYAPFFQSVEHRTVELSGATFHLVLGRGFRYEAYRDRVLVAVRDRFYRIPAYLPQGACVFCERYFAAACPVR
jgi:4-amino-4-deoxy-L-arabinose transferase-like glycosyltransferase